MKKPIYAVVAYMILVYCKVSNYYPMFAQIRAEFLFAVIILIRVALTGNSFKNFLVSGSAINKYLGFLVFSVFFSFIIAWDYQYSWDMAVYLFIKVLILYILIIGAIENKNDIKVLLYSFILMYVYLAYEPMYGFLTGHGGSEYYYGTNYIAESGLLSGHVALANNMNQMLPLTWFFFFSGKGKVHRLICTMSFFVFLIALIGSGSRGGVIGMIIWGCGIIWYSKNRIRTGFIVLLILIAITISSGSSVLHTANRIDKESMTGRFIGLTHGLGMLQKGNLFGVGPGCYLFAREKYFSYRMESHNLYGQIIGDLGLPGMIITFILMVQMFKTIMCIKNKTQRSDKDPFYYYLTTGIQVSLITRLGISMASHGLYFFYWYIMLALLVSLQRLSLNENTENFIGREDNI